MKYIVSAVDVKGKTYLRFARNEYEKDEAVAWIKTILGVDAVVTSEESARAIAAQQRKDVDEFYAGKAFEREQKREALGADLGRQSWE